MTVANLPPWFIRAWLVVRDDLRRQYTGRGLLRLLLGFLAGAILANTPLDQWMEAAYRNRIHSETKTAKACQWVTRQLGDRYVVMLAPAVAVGVCLLAPANPAAAAVGSWGARFVRAFLVATPATYGATWLLGGDRPKNGHGSAWQPLRRVEKGISGHAMAGATPFLAAAGMTANPVAQTVLYACSGLTAWSRVDSRSHYPSQIFLGWWMAFLAARAVRRSGPCTSTVRPVAVTVNNRPGTGLLRRVAAACTIVLAGP